MQLLKRILVTFTAIPLTISSNALSEPKCLQPDEQSAVSVVQAIQSVCVLAKQAAPDGDIDPALGDEINESIKAIGGRLDAPNPFGRCWWDSRYDCMKTKEAVLTLGDQVAAFEDTNYSHPAAAERARAKRIAAVEARDVVVTDIHTFCNTLRH